MKRWDIFCRVIDNLGDAAVCWRLARQLAQEWGYTVRLLIDRPDVLQALQPGARTGHRCMGVQIAPWEAPPGPVADVVIAAFGCELPPAYRRALPSATTVWVNLEYFSAEPWTEASHGLPSPKPQGGVEHFFFPGLGARTGGVLREHDLLARRDAFRSDPDQREAFLRRLGIARPGPIRRVSLFGYPTASWPALLDALDATPTLPGSGPGSDGPWQVLIAEGVLPECIPSHPSAQRPSVLVQRIPFLPQDDYDRLLWSCDLNVVRGEDSLVRALWAGQPMLWQAYPQEASAHRVKVEAWLAHLGVGDGPVADAWLAWNDDQAGAQVRAALLAGLQDWRHWQDRSAALCRHEAALPDLAHRLIQFVHARA
jgi:uncharacterized repeat protein (TIGR03837 family)